MVKATKAQLQGMVARFVDLNEEGQFEAQCSDASQAIDDAKRLLGRKTKMTTVVLTVENNYEIIASVNDGTLERVRISNVDCVD